MVIANDTGSSRISNVETFVFNGVVVDADVLATAYADAVAAAGGGDTGGGDTGGGDTGGGDTGGGDTGGGDTGGGDTGGGDTGGGDTGGGDTGGGDTGGGDTGGGDTGGGDPSPTGADLAIQSLSARDATLKNDQGLRLDLTVANLGDTAEANTKTTFYWSADATFDLATDTVLTTDGHGTLSVGETDSNEGKKIKFKTLLELGDGFIFAQIDAEGNVDEVNEANNISDAVAFSLPQAADLEILSMEARDDTLTQGQKLVLDLSVANSGDTTARGVKTEFYWSADDVFDDSDISLGRDSHGKLIVGEVDSNERMRITYEDLAELGSGYIFGMIDANGRHVETDETNNLSDAVYIELL
ncbi:MAG: CARDB domain-containing protein [Paracoccaceae bacterium]